MYPVCVIAFNESGESIRISPPKATYPPLIFSNLLTLIYGYHDIHIIFYDLLLCQMNFLILQKKVICDTTSTLFYGTLVRQ